MSKSHKPKAFQTLQLSYKYAYDLFCFFQILFKTSGCFQSCRNNLLKRLKLKKLGSAEALCIFTETCASKNCSNNFNSQRKIFNRSSCTSLSKIKLIGIPFFLHKKHIFTLPEPQWGPSSPRSFCMLPFHRYCSHDNA